MLIIIAILLAIIASALLFGSHVTLVVLAAIAVLVIIVCLINKAHEAFEASYPTTPEFQERVQAILRERQAATEQQRVAAEQERQEWQRRLQGKLASGWQPFPLPQWRRDPVTWAIAGIPALAVAAGVVMFFAGYY